MLVSHACVGLALVDLVEEAPHGLRSGSSCFGQFRHGIALTEAEMSCDSSETMAMDRCRPFTVVTLVMRMRMTRRRL